MSTATKTARETGRYVELASERAEHVSAVLNCPSNKKVVVAGPGTGKTFLFKKALEGKTNALTLTFVNALVEDLSLDLCGLSKVRTLHSFARSLLAELTHKDVKISPELSVIVRDDAKLLLGEDIDFEAIFHNREDESEHIGFFGKRKKYYGSYGYSDVIFAAVKHLERHKDHIPAYEQVVVDEFQDFNALEVSLIDLLAEKSPVLIAGDDDQALYDFKHASADYIRERHSSTRPEYSAFSLPFCSRCTRVVVEATNDVISAALQRKHLQGRIEKAYKYFDDKSKDKESAESPQLIYHQVFASQIPWRIQEEIAAMASDLKSQFSVLVISPTKVQSRVIAAALQSKGFSNVDVAQKRGDREAALLESFHLLLEDERDNLGWRILIKFLLEEEEVKKIVTATDGDATRPICDLVNAETRADVKKLISVVRAIKGQKTVESEKLARLFQVLQLDPHHLAQEALRHEMQDDGRVGNPGIRKLAIKATTIQSSKGLSADLVIITHFDDQYFIKNKDKRKINDQEICNFLVALTRARKRVILISSKKEDPTFLKWIRQDRVERRSDPTPTQTIEPELP